MEYQSPPIATPVGLDVRILVQAGTAIAMGLLMSVAGGRNDAEDLRVIDEVVESVTVDQSGLAIMLNPGAVAVDRSCRLLVPWSKPPNRVRHELLPPADR
jgi:hypothetical protein